MVNLACFSGGVKFVDFCRAGVGEVGSVEFCHIGTSGVAVFLEGVASSHVSLFPCVLGVWTFSGAFV